MTHPADQASAFAAPAAQEPTDATEAVSTARLPRAWQDMTLSAQAGIRCSDPLFWGWLGVKDAAAAAVAVRTRCGVDSRRRLNESPEAAAKWKALDESYRDEIAYRESCERFGVR